MKSFGPMSQPLRFQNGNFIVAESPSTAKDYYIQKNTKMHLTASFNVLEERFDQNIARKKKVSLEEDFFPWKCLQNRLFP